MNLSGKFKETLFSVAPIMGGVLLLSFTAVPFSRELTVRFIAGGFMVILGLTLFLLGVDIGILPIGELSGAALTSKKNLVLLLSVSFAIGVMVTFAEPDVQVLASQINQINSNVSRWTLVFMIAIGVGFFVTLGLCRTVLSLKLRRILLLSYILLFALAYACPKDLQGAAFDAGGATTGPMTVPFIMALGMGVASVRSSPKGNNDSSFGLTGIASIGPVAAVALYGIILNFTMGTDPSVFCTTGTDPSEQNMAQLVDTGKELSKGLETFIYHLPDTIKNVSMSLLPLVVMFIFFQIFLLKMPPVQLRKMCQGVIYCFIGLVIFLLGAEGGFMPAGKQLGEMLGYFSFVHGKLWTVLIVSVAFVFGAITVCAEPAVWVLTEQVENASGGTIKRKILLTSLSCGVAISIALSVLKIIYGFSLWYILVPGYALALALMFVCPPLFTGIAFDSGGVASGPMTSTFILSFTLGVASNQVDCGESAFGVIALVAMTPLIAIQILGIIYKIKTREAAK